MGVADLISTKLRRAFDPVRLDVVDDSARHFGHAGAPPGGESHFNVVIVSRAFEGQSRVARQRAVHAALSEELAGPVHALSLRLLTPEEDGAAAS
jgi:BolA protein